MGVGGSTSSRPGSETTRCNNKLLSRSGSARSLSSHKHTSERPTGSCCFHYKKNHTTLTRPGSSTSKEPLPNEDNINDDIEEIVANTLDLASANKRSVNYYGGDSEANTGMDTGSTIRHLVCSGSSEVELRKTFRSGSIALQKRPKNNLDEVRFDAKDCISEVDFAKFKKVNHKGTTIAPSGRVIHHQENDLLWRLGLISPEAYKTEPRPAPSNNSGPYLKTPSYDLTEEQLMANIEKEFATAI